MIGDNPPRARRAAMRTTVGSSVPGRTSSALCGAKTRSGKPCPMPPVKGRTRCRMHGGKTPVGADHPSFIHGRRSKYWKGLSGPLKAAHARVKAEGAAVLSLYEGVATMDERLAELSARIEEGDSPEWRTKVRDAWIIARHGDASAIRELDALIERGTARDSAWEEMFERLGQRGKRAENAIAIDLKRDETLSHAEVFGALQELFNALRTALPDAPCPQCNSSADRAIEVIRSRALMPENKAGRGA